MAIIAGLNLSSISRLKKTWSKTPSKYIQQMEDMVKLMQAEGNFRNYRTALEKATPPANPYFGMNRASTSHTHARTSSRFVAGVFLRDLTFVEVGNPDKLDNLINFDKLRMISVVLRDVKKFQQQTYSFEVIPSILDYYQSSVKLNDQALQKYSLLCEASYGEGTKRTEKSTTMKTG
jgi:Ras-specific guanine nucleotide-releasing factor 1